MFAAFIDGLAGASTDDLDAALGAAKAKRDAADMEIAAISAVVDSRKLYQDHGHRSVNGYLKQQLNCSAVEASRIKARGRLCNQYPKIGDALGDSRIGAEAVSLLANGFKHPRANDRFAEFAPILTEKAEHLEHFDFAITVKHFISQADPDGSFKDQEFHEDQRTASVRVEGGAVNVHASGGDPIRAAEMKKIFELAVQAEVRKDFEARRKEFGDDALNHPMPRSAEQRCFDAIYEIFMDSVTAPADGLRPEPLVNLVSDINTVIDVLTRHGFLDVQGADDAEPVDPSTHRCQTSTGIQVHPDAIMKAMLRGSVRRVLVDAHDVIINMGRTQRLFTGKARQAAQLLAATCGHRGCDIPAEFCDVDHVDEWAADTGGTDQDNALPLCGVHDRWKHHKRLRGRRDINGRIHLIKPDGHVIKPLGARDPIWAEPEHDEPERDEQREHLKPAALSRHTGNTFKEQLADPTQQQMLGATIAYINRRAS